jgi:hypothetical protein
MKPIAIAASLAILANAPGSLAGPAVDVRFPSGEHYSDSQPHNPLVDERAQALEHLRKHLQALGAKLLADGDTLRVEILDIDLAGEFHPVSRPEWQLRVLRPATPPRIHLRYTLQRGVTTVSGETRLLGLDYLRDPRTCEKGGPLCHEKRLLQDWFVGLVGNIAN